MNCPTCGAENEAEAHFCAECGTPLAVQGSETVNPAGDEDATLISTQAELRAAAAARTVTIEPERAGAAEPESIGHSDSPSERPQQPDHEVYEGPSTATTPAEGVPAGTEPEVDERNGPVRSNRLLWGVVAVLALFLLCGCFCLLGIAGFVISEPDAFDELMRDFAWFSGFLIV